MLLGTNIVISALIATSLIEPASCGIGTLIAKSIAGPANALTGGETDELDIIGLPTKELIEFRGYKAENHHVVSEDGYITNIVRATNPLINEGRSGLENRPIVLCVHGSITNAQGFIINSIGARPKDYSQLGEAELRDVLSKDPARNSILPLLLNLGCEVWAVNKRGTMASLGRTNGRNGTDSFLNFDPKAGLKSLFDGFGPKVTAAGSNLTEVFDVIVGFFNDILQSGSVTVNSDYWEFAADQQAEFDFPAWISYIRRQTGRDKVSVVGHSAGGAITLMALAIHPDLANELDQIVLWAPATDLGHTLPEGLKYAVLPELFADYVGPVPPTEVTPLIRDGFVAVCSTDITRATICQPAANALFGSETTKHQQLLSGFLYEIFDTVSAWELAQLGQCFKFGGVQHFFDYQVPEKNLKAYGSVEPPVYNYSRILRSTKLTLLAGSSDELVFPLDVETFIKTSGVPVDFRIIESPDNSFFNHISFLIDDNTGDLLNIPTAMKMIFGT